MFRARPLATFVLAIGFVACARIASAQDAAPLRLDFSTVPTMAALLGSTTAAPVRFNDVPMQPIVAIRPKQWGASKGLMGSLYASTAVMQALDVHSTLRAFGAGATEGNPLMAGATRNTARFIATKAAVTAGTIFVASKIAKKNKLAAVITLVAINSAYAMVVAHNYDVARRR